MKELDKLLKDNGIEPTKKEQWNPAPNEMLEDFFKTLGDIFTPYTDKNNIRRIGCHKDLEDE